MNKYIYIDGVRYSVPNEIIKKSHKHHKPRKWVNLWFYKNRNKTKIDKKNIKDDLIITSKCEYQKDILYKMSAVSKADDCFDYYFTLKDNVPKNIVKKNNKYKDYKKSVKKNDKRKTTWRNLPKTQPERDPATGRFIVRFP